MSPGWENKIFIINQGEEKSIRLDTKYWIPSVYEIYNKVLKGKYTSHKLGDFITDIHYGVSTENIYVDFGIPLLRIQNLKREGLDLYNIVYLPEEKRSEIGKAIVNIGDILISRSGSVGIVVVVPKEVNGFAFGSFMIKFCLNDKINKHFVALWLNSEICKKLIEREKIGAIQGNITIGTIKNFNIPIPPLQVQDNIVNLFNSALFQKLQKETEAQQLLASIDPYILGELGIELPEEKKEMCFEVWSDEIEGRVDPMCFHPSRLEAIKATKKCGITYYSLSDTAEFRREIVKNISYGETYIGLENITSKTGYHCSTEDKYSVSSAFKFYKGDVLFPKLRPYLNKVYFADFNGLCSTEFHVLKAHLCDPYYLYAFLSRSIVVRQTERLMTGNTLPRLQTEDVENLIISVPPLDIQTKIVEEVQSRRAKAKALMEEADALIKDAYREFERALFE